MLDIAHAREMMVQRHLVRRGLQDERLLSAMRAVPRERFVPADLAELAYDDAPLPIGEGQTISQPYVVALMIDAAGVRPGDRVMEVGAGSGYAAAVLSRIAARVVGIERHRSLADEAAARVEALGYDNVRIICGDGTMGLPEEAPFDAIIVSAGGPEAPRSLKDQLAVGGRLVMPVGERSNQRLVRIRRLGADRFEEEDLGGVRFVPLVGEHGWREAAAPLPLPVMIAAAAEELPPPDDEAFGAAFDRFGDRKIVLLGESSHGTSEFYRARAAITRRLVERHGFTVVAVEADWPDAAAIDRHVRHLASRPDDQPFRRFPTWMWRNTDMADFVGWLRMHNGRVDDTTRRAGFYGLDLYSLGASIEAVLGYLDGVDPEAAAIARERYGCLEPWRREPSSYGRAMMSRSYSGCEEAVVAQCRELLARSLDLGGDDGDSFLDAAQNARLVAAAETYYRTMYRGGESSWNLRDRHMFNTLANVLDARGPDAKAVVWAHNSHVGDARATEMGTSRDELSLGQLCRERFGEAAVLIGFGTHTGTVAAATDWGGAMEVKRVRPSREESVERLFHESRRPRHLVDFGRHAELAERLGEPRLERFIGVIYRPETELQSHYAQAQLSRQFDAFVWFDETRAVTPLPVRTDRDAMPDTWPTGL